MTRKDYVALAAALRQARKMHVISEFDADIFAAKALDTAAYEVADVLAADNPRFDRKRFLKAAGVQ